MYVDKCPKCGGRMEIYATWNNVVQRLCTNCEYQDWVLSVLVLPFCEEVRLSEEKED